MSEILYRIIDATQGAVILLLVVFVYRLLIVRRDGALRVRHLAGLFFLITALQTFFWFLLEEEERTDGMVMLYLGLGMDLIALLSNLGMGWILWRNRHLYERRMITLVMGLLATQWLCYAFCAAFRFADWTSLVYLPVSGLLWGAIGWILDYAKPKEVIPLSLEKQEDAPFLTELNRVLMQDRYFCDETITRDEVCRRMLTNRTTFSQRLNETAGITFSEYLREMRLREAARLLRETDMPVDQIAYEVGLRSASGFHRNFLLSYGKTPKQYRIDHRA